MEWDVYYIVHSRISKEAEPDVWYESLAAGSAFNVQIKSYELQNDESCLYPSPNMVRRNCYGIRFCSEVRLWKLSGGRGLSLLSPSP